jgi:uroporphyrinogen decarboxylase
MTPEFAAEVTLQPIARFGLDAAIIFSDILVVPFALGSEVSFDEGVGPRLEPVRELERLERDPSVWAEKLSPVYDALRLTRQRLERSCALLGFAGAPWTLATYMAEGGGSSDQRAAKLWGYRDPEGFRAFLDLIEECVSQHLISQIRVGADAVQLFDSWASGLPEHRFEEWVIAPTKRIVDKIRKVEPQAKIVGFPRGASLRGYERYARETGVDAISIDTGVPIGWAVETIGRTIAIQGNLDPIALVAGGAAQSAAIETILEATKARPFIFNLGHGVVPETPPEHIADLVAQIRAAT